MNQTLLDWVNALNAPFVLMLLKDYRRQLKQGIKEPVFKLDCHPKYKAKVDCDIWSSNKTAMIRGFFQVY